MLSHWNQHGDIPDVCVASRVYWPPEILALSAEVVAVSLRLSLTNWGRLAHKRWRKPRFARSNWVNHRLAFPGGLTRRRCRISSSRFQSKGKNLRRSCHCQSSIRQWNAPLSNAQLWLSINDQKSKQSKSVRIKSSPVKWKWRLTSFAHFRSSEDCYA